MWNFDRESRDLARLDMRERLYLEKNEADDRQPSRATRPETAISRVLERFSDALLQGAALLGFVLAAAAWLGGCLLLAGSLLYGVAIQTAAWIAPLPVVVFGAVLILPAGTYLFNLRKAHRGFYGMVELAAGVLLGSYALFKSHQEGKGTVAEGLDLDTFTAMLSGVYVVVRGLDNIDKAKKERSAVREKERAEEDDKARAQAIEARARVMRAIGPAYSSEG